MVGFKYKNNYETWIMIWGRSGSTCLFWNDFVPIFHNQLSVDLKKKFYDIEWLRNNSQGVVKK